MLVSAPVLAVTFLDFAVPFVGSEPVGWAAEADSAVEQGLESVVAGQVLTAAVAAAVEVAEAVVGVAVVAVVLAVVRAMTVPDGYLSRKEDEAGLVEAVSLALVLGYRSGCGYWIVTGRVA